MLWHSFLAHHAGLCGYTSGGISPQDSSLMGCYGCCCDYSTGQISTSPAIWNDASPPVVGALPPALVAGSVGDRWVGTYPISSDYIALSAAMTMVVHGIVSMYA